MTEERFSFRWGISLLDEGDTRIPNFFWVYADLRGKTCRREAELGYNMQPSEANQPKEV